MPAPAAAPAEGAEGGLPDYVAYAGQDRYVGVEVAQCLRVLDATVWDSANADYPGLAIAAAAVACRILGLPQAHELRAIIGQLEFGYVHVLHVACAGLLATPPAQRVALVFNQGSSSDPVGLLVAKAGESARAAHVDVCMSLSQSH